MIHAHVPFAQYVGQPGMNISRLKWMRFSPQHYQHQLKQPIDNDTLRAGRVSHCAVLEPAAFDTRYVVWERISDKGNLCPRNGQYWDAFVAQALKDKREPISIDDRANALAIQKAVHAEPAAMTYLQDGNAEVSMSWSMHGRACKGRLDWLILPCERHPRPTIVGLKSAPDVRHFVFGAHAVRMGYHLQWAWYFDGFRSQFGEAPQMVEIVVEKKPPHAVAVYRITGDIIAQGREEYEQLLQVLDDCEATGVWPGPTGGIEQDLSLPTWAYTQAPTDDLSELELEGA